MSWNNRLEIALRESKMSQTELAKRLGVTPSSINKMLKGKQKTIPKAELLAEILGVDALWLEKGVGYRGKSNRHDCDRIEDEKMSCPVLKSIDSFSPDGMSFEEDDIIDVLSFPKEFLKNPNYDVNFDKVLCFKVSDSSLAPNIAEGAYAFFDGSNKTIISGKIYAVSVRGVNRLAVVIRETDEKLTLRTFNQDVYPTASYPVSDVRIMGRVIVSMNVAL